ncbi:MAG: hypothetical protein A4E44_01920 [Methanosaeta sp. PtaB.Bin018]|jgi:hypothetical protein|nr:MAG: hypothetical protein A4E44_01920 [Methanosaeta sp. PtaB.Bin018]OPY46498.1 MAG: hypothetical protein A4E46_00881 [Methanosaeta sp. PtaU1.Bin016]
MNISDFAEDYLFDKKEGMRNLTACLLNEVMQLVQHNTSYKLYTFSNHKDHGKEEGKRC